MADPSTPPGLEGSSTLAGAHAAMARGDLAQAARMGERLTSEHPNDPATWLLLSEVHFRARRLEAALGVAERALGLGSDDPEVLLHYAKCLVALGRRADTLAVVERAERLGLDRADWNDRAGALLTLCDEPARARPFFERAVSGSPDNPAFLYNQAAVQRMTGDLGGAERTLETLLRISPGHVPAHYMRSGLRTQTEASHHIPAMLALLASGRLSFDDKVMLGYALAKELEDVAEYEASFHHLAGAASLQRRRMTYDVADDIATMDGLKAHHRAVPRDEGEGPGDERIFVMGLPRSGTTLLERLISAHSGVSSIGESPAFPEQCVRAVAETGPASSKSHFVQRLLDIDAGAIGRAYLKAAPAPPGGAVRVVDKLPMNYLYAATIARALPRARLLIIARDPLDACYAMFKTLFTNAYPFSYDLTDLARYYAAWHGLVRHWQQTLGPRLLTVQYEDLVSDPEATARRVLDHCHAPWEASVMKFHEAGAPVMTASAVQVRQPIYASSVGSWRPFERQLRPLGEFLDRARPDGGWRLGDAP